jgi:hypothetical protein
MPLLISSIISLAQALPPIITTPNARCDTQVGAVAAALLTDFCRAVAIHVHAPCVDSVLAIACKRFEAA